MPFTTLPTPVSCPPSPRTDQLPSTSSTPLAHPDSTHQPYSAPFTEGEDILVHDPDGLIYFGILVEVDHDQGQCLVRFGDSTERWANFYDLRRLEEEESSLNVSDEAAGGKATTIEQFHQELSRLPCLKTTFNFKTNIKMYLKNLTRLVLSFFFFIIC